MPDEEVIEVDVFDAIRDNVVKHKTLFAYIVGLLVIAWVLLGAVPSWSPVENSVEITAAQVAQKADDGDIVEMTVQWAAPFAKSCFLANDVRPAGAATGVPETEEWNQNHLIRYNVNTGQLLAEYWINIEVIQQRENTQTFRYKLAPANAPYDLYSELRCDDESLGSSGPFKVEG